MPNTFLAFGIRASSLGSDHPTIGVRVPLDALFRQIPETAITKVNGRTKEETDAFFVHYDHDNDTPYRLSGLSPDDTTPTFHLMSLDFDLERIAPFPKSWKYWSMEKEMGELYRLNPLLKHAACVTPSRGGVRAIFILSRPLSKDEWRGGILSLLSMVTNTKALHVDTVCSDWTRLMRIPFGWRENSPVTAQPYCDPDFITVDTTRRLDVDTLDLTCAKPLKGRSAPGVVSPIKESIDLPPQTCASDLFDPRPIKAWNNHVFKLIMRLSDADPFATRHEIMEQADPVLSAMAAVDCDRRNWRQIGWSMIQRLHTPRLPDIPPPPPKTSPADVEKAMADVAGQIKKSKGVVLLSTPPGSKKSLIMLGELKAVADLCGGVMCSPSRHHRDEMASKYGLPHTIRLSNEEIAIRHSGLTESYIKKLSAAFDDGVTRAQRSIYKNTTRPEDFTNFVRWNKDEEKFEPRNYFEWLGGPYHKVREGRGYPVVSEKALAALQQARRANDAECWKSPVIFTTHDSLVPLWRTFKRRLTDDPVALAEARKKVEELESLGIEGLDALDKARNRMRNLASRETDPLCGRIVLFDEVEPEHLLTPEFAPEGEVQVWNQKTVVSLYDPWTVDDMSDLQKVFNGAPKTILCSANKGVLEKLAGNVPHFDADLKILDEDFEVVFASTKHMTEDFLELNAPPAERERLFQLYKHDISTYSSEVESILERCMSTREKLVRSATQADAVICSGKRWKPKTGKGAFLKLEPAEPISPTNLINVVGTNKLVNKSLVTVLSMPSPERIAKVMLLAGVDEDEASLIIAANDLNQAASRNVGCRGYDFVVEYYAKQGEPPPKRANKHIAIIPPKLADVLKRITPQPPPENIHIGLVFDDVVKKISEKSAIIA